MTFARMASNFQSSAENSCKETVHHVKFRVIDIGFHLIKDGHRGGKDRMVEIMHFPVLRNSIGVLELTLGNQASFIVFWYLGSSRETICFL